ncbi:MAG: glycosyltransferase family 4 protein [Nitrospiraceae bacterium]|nr:glycosyltransferase family 4 protein [Nitrospiraceae bacterium]
MRILHLLYESRGDYFGTGGVATRAYEIYRRLKDRHDITLLCKRYPGAQEGEIEGLRHAFAGIESKSLLKTLLSYAFQAARWVRERQEEYDVIVEEFSPAIPTFLHAVARKPVVLQVQGYTGSLYFRKYNPLYAAALVAMEQLRPAGYADFIFISPETAAGFRRKAASRVGIIENGVSPELLAVPMTDGGYVLYLGRIDIYGKGLDLLLSAYAEFSDSFPSMRLRIAGDGRDMKEFREMISRLPGGVREKVDLIGWVSGGVKTEVLQKAAFAVFPSRHEVQPIAVLEAMACGKAVVVSDIPGFSVATKSGGGLSFRRGDASALASAMKTLAVNKKQMKELGIKGRERVTDLTWDRIAQRYEKFLIETAERK